ncbi:AtpZ/AtpI family protein [Robiginitalea sediminis]|uniref:AtpZ/AtpI family protein n=1 Tax=Robiginitalea sediminis TaxID=1982593 RepID=UPI001E4A6F44|nr:AtpZ/AtpI family protein [Robiginitalea sediminis]
MLKPPERDPVKRPLRNLAALSGIAIEMGVIIYLAARGGMWLDAHFQMEKRLFTALCTLVGVGVSLWVVLRQIRRIRY